MSTETITNGRCPICEGTHCVPRFQVPFPRHSEMGYHGFTLAQQVDVATWTIVECLDCTAHYPHPYPTREEIDSFYAGQQHPNEWEQEYYVEVRPEVRASWGEFAEKIARLRGGPGRLLEIGCAAGWLLKAARDQGWEVAGLEAAPKFQRYATKTLGLPVQLGTIDALAAPPSGETSSGESVLGNAPFDVIVMSDVIEHLHDPVADLKKIRKRLAPDGYLILSTCDIGSPGARFYGVNWRQIILSHTVYWTKRSMRHALRRAGFRVERFSEVRYWDPAPSRERNAKLREGAKLLARAVLHTTYSPLARHFAGVQKLPALLTRHRLTHDNLMFKVGDQPILGDVMLVVARPINVKTTSAKSRGGRV